MTIYGEIIQPAERYAALNGYSLLDLIALTACQPATAVPLVESIQRACERSNTCLDLALAIALMTILEKEEQLPAETQFRRRTLRNQVFETLTQ